jgi:hypothetical protein
LLITPSVVRHLPEFPEHIEQARPGPADRTPAIAIADGAACSLRKATADDDWRIRFLHRFRPGHDLVKTDHVAVILGLGLAPNLLHRFDPLVHRGDQFCRPEVEGLRLGTHATRVGWSRACSAELYGLRRAQAAESARF